MKKKKKKTRIFLRVIAKYLLNTLFEKYLRIYIVYICGIYILLAVCQTLF